MANVTSLSLNPTGTANMQYAYAPDSASLSVTSNLTLECWINLGTLSSVIANGQTCFGKETTSNVSYRIIVQTDDKFYLRLSSDGAAVTSGSNNSTIGTGAWTHLACAYYAAGGSALFYKNGTIDGTVTGAPTSIYDGTAPLQLGATSGIVTPIQYGQMLIDEVRVWNTTRSAAEILANYQTQLVGTETGLNAYYSLNNSLNDITANANNLTIINSPLFSGSVPFGGAAISSGLQAKYW